MQSERCWERTEMAVDGVVDFLAAHRDWKGTAADLSRELNCEPRYFNVLAALLMLADVGAVKRDRPGGPFRVIVPDLL